MSDRKPRFTLTRRELFRATQVVGAGAAAAGLGLWGRARGAERTVQGTCRICTMKCGLVATVRGDRLVRVEGDPKSQTKGFLCQHGYALPEIVHAADRVRRPLARVGDRFEERSWEEALGQIASRLQAVKEKFGPQAVAVHTGWPFVRHPLVPFLQRFCHAFGTPNLSGVASLCEAALRMGKALTVGSNTFADLPRTRTLVLWGANPPMSAPPFAHQVAAKAGAGKNLVVIDPVRTQLAAGATLHLQVLPSTDGALALAMIRLLLREGLHDRVTVEQHSVGFEELAAVAEPWTLERAAQETSVPAEKIERAARLMGQEKPTAVWDGLGIEHHVNGLQTIRAVTSLQALLGVVEVPGGVSFFNKPTPQFQKDFLPALFHQTNPKPLPPMPAAKPIGYDSYPLYEVFNRQAQGNLYPEAILEDRPYPLRALIFVGCNPLVTWPGTERLRGALSKLELLVSVDPFLTATGEASHFVLPAATFAESSVPTLEHEARSSLVREQHEAWPDWKIFFDLARRLGMQQYFPWSSFREAMDTPRVPWMADPAHQPRPLPGVGVGAAPRFPTETGKVEFRSELMARFGAPAVPDYVPARVRPGPEFPLWLVTGGRTRNFVNSQFHNVHSVVIKDPEASVELHPDAAKVAGVADGDQVLIRSPHGEVEARLRVTDRVHPLTAVVPAGWTRGNANLLTDGTALDPVTGFPAVRSGVCRVSPASGSGSRHE